MGSAFGLSLVHHTEQLFNSSCKGQRVHMIESNPRVFIVDDDASVRDALKRLLRSVGLRCELFGSAQEFLRYRRPDLPSCLVLAVRLPGPSGLVFKARL